MFDYSPRQIEKFLVLDRTLIKYITKTHFRASGTIEVTYRDGSACEYDDLSTAALAIHLCITTREATNEPT